MVASHHELCLFLQGAILNSGLFLVLFVAPTTDGGVLVNESGDEIILQVASWPRRLANR